ncbi:MAG: glycosyltransferase [Rhodospirillales bacterium]|nr:glycosyltransferase [Rhodospirillales bacterium]
MRVLQAMAGAKHGGAEAFFMRLVPAIHRAGVEQLVMIRRNAERAAALREAGIEPVEVPFGGALDMVTPLAFRREIKGFKPDVVLTWMNRATKFCPAGDFVHVSRLGGYYDLKYHQACDHLVGNTPDIRDYLIGEGWPAEKAHYLPNFVDQASAEPFDRKELYTPYNARVIFAMGRLHENKAFDVLLDAMARMPDVYLWIAGDGPLREELDTQAESTGVKPRIRFLGWREDTAALLAACDIFVCPSRHEPLGNVVLEAWAARKPVVAADSAGPGMLIDHMKSGVLIPVDDSESLANAILAVFEDDDLRGQIAHGGRAAFEANYTEPIVVGKYIKLFERLMAEKSHNSKDPG